MSCICNDCGKKYKMDLLVSDDIWVKITPAKNKEAGLLCPKCIIKKIEELYDYSAFKLIMMQ